jgi:hypothetical protein
MSNWSIQAGISPRRPIQFQDIVRKYLHYSTLAAAETIAVGEDFPFLANSDSVERAR